MANTTEDRVIAINLKSQQLTGFVQPGVNVPVEDEDAGVTGFNSPDNLAVSPDGALWIVEDNVPSDIWAVSRHNGDDGIADQVELFASMVDPDAEGTGLYFGQDPHTVFINVQHAAKPLADGTWTITCR